MVRKCSFFVFLKYMMIQLPNSEIIFKFHFAFKVNGKKPIVPIIKKIIHNKLINKGLYVCSQNEVKLLSVSNMVAYVLSLKK